MYFIFSCICFMIVLFGYQAKAAASKLFGNMTYLTDCPYIAEQVTLVNGQGVLWNQRLHVSLYYEGHYVYGDFNRDGLQDAAVVIGESEGGSGDFRSLAFLINDGAKLVHQQSGYLGSSTIIRSMTAQQDQVTVDMLVHQDGDCMAGPTKRVKYVYAYGGPDTWVEATPLK